MDAAFDTATVLVEDVAGVVVREHDSRVPPPDCTVQAMISAQKP